MQSTVSGPDARYLDDDEHQKALRAEYDEAYAQGSEGQRDDMQLVLEEWGFDISEISVPTIIWHGTDDEVVPTEMSKHLEEAIPGTRRVLFPKTGHFLVERDDLWDVLVRVVASHARENI